VAGLALGMVFRFTTYKRWVFVSPERAAARAVAEGSVAEVNDDTAQPAEAAARRPGRNQRFRSRMPV
jgi:hypothetical protein